MASASKIEFIEMQPLPRTTIITTCTCNGEEGELHYHKHTIVRADAENEHLFADFVGEIAKNQYGDIEPFPLVDPKNVAIRGETAGPGGIVRGYVIARQTPSSFLPIPHCFNDLHAMEMEMNMMNVNCPCLSCGNGALVGKCPIIMKYEPKPGCSQTMQPASTEPVASTSRGSGYMGIGGPFKAPPNVKLGDGESKPSEASFSSDDSGKANGKEPQSKKKSFLKFY